jgi:uncharacterized protein YndB with AHSA1/START domain
MSDRGDERDDRSDLALVVRRTIRAPAARLFEAWTRPEHLRRWWGPSTSVACPEAEVDLRVGGRYKIANRFPDGKLVWIVGEFRSISAPRELVYTWRIEPGPETTELVTVRFTARGADTDVVIVHESIATKAARRSHEEGWGGCLEGLARYVEAES